MQQSVTLNPHDHYWLADRLFMRVLGLIDSLVAHGAERSLASVAPLINQKGIDLDVAYLAPRHDLAADLRGAGISVTDLGGPGGRLAASRRVADLLRREKYDLVHTTLFEADIAGRTAARIAGIASVSTWAATEPTCNGGLVHLAKRKAAVLLDATTARSAARFHAVSEPVADAVGRRLHVDSDRIEVIPRGRDAGLLGERTSQRRVEVRRSLKLEQDALVVLALARHDVRKGVDLLIAAASELHRSWPNLRVIVAGDHGPETARLQAMIVERRLEGVVSLVGPSRNVGDLLAMCDMCAVPSRSEGFPGVVVEAMAIGTPVVAADLASVRSAMPDPGFGWLVRPEDVGALAYAIDDVVRRPDTARWRAERARSHYEKNFTLDNAASAMISFYERAVR